MVNEDFSLGRLRGDLLKEFGRDSTDDSIIEIANNKINDAIAWIANSKHDWPWLMSNLIVDVQQAGYTTGTVTLGNQTIQNVGQVLPVEGSGPTSGTGPTGGPIVNPGSEPSSTFYNNNPINPGGGGGSSGGPTIGGGFGIGLRTGPTVNASTRQIVTTNSTSPTSGYVIQSVGTSSITLISQWLEASATDTTIYLVTGYAQLPDEFRKMKTLEVRSPTGITIMSYLTPIEFDHMVAKQSFGTQGRQYYTIKNDPIRLNDSRYIAFYPYLAERMTIYGIYWRGVPKLVNDGDIPIVPIDDRLTILHAAYWYMSAHLKEDYQKTNFYKAQALEDLASMKVAYEYSSQPRNLAEDDTGSDFGFLQLPRTPRF